MDTFQLVQRALAKRVGVEPSEIAPEIELMTLGVDSLDSAELLMELEEVLGVEIEVTSKIKTVKDIVVEIDQACKDG
ncbi:MAG: phosphopantetheine-binding protein [Thermoguttaceae bacterium]